MRLVEGARAPIDGGHQQHHVAAPERADPALSILQQSGADAARLFSLRDKKQLQVCRAIQGACRDDPGEADNVGTIERDEDQVAFSQALTEARVCTMASERTDAAVCYWPSTASSRQVGSCRTQVSSTLLFYRVAQAVAQS